MTTLGMLIGDKKRHQRKIRKGNLGHPDLDRPTFFYWDLKEKVKVLVGLPIGSHPPITNCPDPRIVRGRAEKSTQAQMGSFKRIQEKFDRVHVLQEPAQPRSQTNPDRT